MKEKKTRILILGASGFLGHSIYKELSQYFNTYGTYRLPTKKYLNNKSFFEYDHKEDDIVEILQKVKPTIIISALKGLFETQIIAHRHATDYLKLNSETKIIFLSSANVFDAYSKYPSYENDTRLSNSIYGLFKIKIEYLLQKLPKKSWTIIRLPMVFGLKSNRINEIMELARMNEPIELFPNLIINVCSVEKLTRQLHYIINRNKSGIFHCGSSDLVHHEYFMKDLIKCLGVKKPKYKFVYTTNEERYLAVLPKFNSLPKYLQFESNDVLEEVIKLQ